ncbi:hypothetical protein Tco_1344656 [Tanacetum coccineum]
MKGHEETTSTTPHLPEYRSTAEAQEVAEGEEYRNLSLVITTACNKSHAIDILDWGDLMTYNRVSKFKSVEVSEIDEKKSSIAGNYHMYEHVLQEENHIDCYVSLQKHLDTNLNAQRAIFKTRGDRTLRLLGQSSNRTLGRPWVKMSAIWIALEIYGTYIITIYNGGLSQYTMVAFQRGIWSSSNTLCSQHDSETALTTPRYSALELERDRKGWHFDDQENKLSPR